MIKHYYPVLDTVSSRPLYAMIMTNHYYPFLADVSSVLGSCAGLGSGAGACSAELCFGLAAGMAHVIQLLLVAICIWDWEQWPRQTYLLKHGEADNPCMVSMDFPIFNMYSSHIIHVWHSFQYLGDFHGEHGQTQVWCFLFAMILLGFSKCRKLFSCFRFRLSR